MKKNRSLAASGVSLPASIKATSYGAGGGTLEPLSQAPVALGTPKECLDA